MLNIKTGDRRILWTHQPYAICPLCINAEQNTGASVFSVLFSCKRNPFQAEVETAYGRCLENWTTHFKS